MWIDSGIIASANVQDGERRGKRREGLLLRTKLEALQMWWKLYRGIVNAIFELQKYQSIRQVVDGV